MNKTKVLESIKELGAIAVIRGKDVEEALKFSKACVSGGINILEITFTVPNADEVIKTLTEELGDEVLIGAGTVLDEVSGRIAIMSGAKFIVSPSFDREVAKLCNLYQVPYMPGCITPTEITEALKYGVDVIKIFPGSLVGPSYIKALKGPFPNVNLMPTGGVDVENVRDWLKSGAFAVGIGSSLAKGESEEIIEKAKAFLSEIDKERNND